MRLVVCALVLVTAWPLLAGDFCVVVCDDPAHRPERTCPSPTFRSSAEIASDFRLIAQGGAPSWPFGAFGNGFFQFCSSAERQRLMAVVVETIPTASANRRDDLIDFACMVAPKTALAAIRDLPREQRRKLSKARAKLTQCASAR